MPAHALDDRCQQGTPPHRRLWGPLGKGGALCNCRSTAVPVGPPRPSSITHPEVALATVTCSYRLAQVDSWLGQQHNMTTTKRSAVGNAWAGWGSIPVFFPPGWQVTRVSPYVRGPFPSKEIRRIPERVDPGPPVVPGGSGSVWDPEPSKERVGDWGGPATVWSLLCVAETRARRPNEEWGYSTRRQCWATSAQRRCHPEEALYLPTVSHLFDCQ